MADTVASELRKTPLHARHRASNARMVPFAGWDMPVEYSGITNEHLAVRTRAGVFDVSHMGEIEIAGKDALAAVQRISSNDASLLQIGQAQYAGAHRRPMERSLTTCSSTAWRRATSCSSSTPRTPRRHYAWISEQIKAVGDAAPSTRAAATR